MAQRILAVLLALSLLGALTGTAQAGILGYSLDKAERGFSAPPQAEPSSPKVAADALIARPLGLALTIAGTGLFVATLPMSIGSPESRQTAARALIVKPAGYTFVRPFGKPDPRFMEKTIFGP